MAGRMEKTTALATGILVVLALGLASEADAVCDPVAMVGRVTAVEDGRAILDVGSGDGVVPGTRFAIVAAPAVDEHPKLGHPLLCDDDASGVTAVIEVDEVSGGTCSGTIGRGSAANAGDWAVETERYPTGERGWPGGAHAYLNLWEVSLRFRIIATGEQDGVAFPNDLAISWQLPIPLKLTVMSSPGLIGEGDDPVGTSATTFSVAYSGRLFEIGIGIGGWFSTAHPAHEVALVQTLRLGPVSGINFRLRTLFIGGTDHDDGEGERGLRFDAAWGEFRVPVHRVVTLYLELGLGGGNTGDDGDEPDWVRFSAGVLLYLRGTGGPGTVILPFGIGFSGYEVEDANCDGFMETCPQVVYRGFTIATGLDFRW